GKRYLLVNLHFSVFILQFAINTEAGQPQTPKVVQFPSTQTFSSAQRNPHHRQHPNHRSGFPDPTTRKRV
ncbi:hypothetical protein, partial [Rubripirellula obstinata]|uniref:hypothetical protein n=1 Tax=Rubripirellula obstinata TaxID=406547 RepID=UPI001EE3E7F4